MKLTETYSVNIVLKGRDRREIVTVVEAWNPEHAKVAAVCKAENENPGYTAIVKGKPMLTVRHAVDPALAGALGVLGCK